MNDYLTSDMTMIDVGAHTGHYSMGAAKRCKQVYSFEADGEVIPLLLSNVTGYTNIIVGNYLLWDKVESLLFNISASGQHWASNVKAKPIVRNVTSTTLDELFIANDWPMNIDFMKIDIEGAELRCLRGATEILKQSPKMGLIIEVGPGHLERVGNSKDELKEFLNLWKFKETEPQIMDEWHYEKKYQHVVNCHFVRNVK